MSDWLSRPGPTTADGRDLQDCLEPIYGEFVLRRRRLERQRQAIWMANHRKPGWLDRMQPVCRRWWSLCDEANCKLYDLQRFEKQRELRAPHPYSNDLDRYLRHEVVRLGAEIDGLRVEILELEREINGAAKCP